MEKQFVSHLQDKDVVQSTFLLRDRSIHTGRNGRSYMSLILADNSGSVDGRAWDNVDELAATYRPGDIVKVRGIVQIFQNRKQVVIHRMDRADDKEINLEQLMPTSTVNVENLRTQLNNYVDALINPFIKQLVERALSHPDVEKRFFTSPAAKTIHHAYPSGLLEHVVSICGLMQFLAGHYPFLNKDLLIFGAIFHDLGKIWELQSEATTTYTDEGRLVGHLVMSVEFVDRLSSQIPEFPEQLRLLLKHIVLSHHGKLEFGSPKLPQFLEAFIVAAIDDLDSKINTIYNFMESERQSGQKWTRFNQMFDRYFYLGISADSATAQNSALQPELEAPTPSLAIPKDSDGLVYKK